MMQMIRRFKDLGITGSSARWYDKNSREHRLDEMNAYADEVASHIKPGASVLEVAPGPGYLSIALAKAGDYQITGLDISADFVAIAQRNAKQANVNIDFRQGNAADMPFRDNQFDFIICTAAFKNFKEPVKAMNEMMRVLKPRGIALIIDMNRNASRSALRDEIKSMGVKGMDAAFMHIAFNTFLKQGAYTSEGLKKMAAQTSCKVFVLKEMGISLYAYLHK